MICSNLITHSIKQYNNNTSLTTVGTCINTWKSTYMSLWSYGELEHLLHICLPFQRDHSSKNEFVSHKYESLTDKRVELASRGTKFCPLNRNHWGIPSKIEKTNKREEFALGGANSFLLR